MVLQRQRDFVARVSHELKTPLAGIRVMAETIEIGAVRDEAQRAQFARRIVTEAEKLTDRVNEVLRAAARPDDDVPVPVDIDALVTDLAAAWQPRFEQVGATLAVETVHVGRVVAMPVLLRDALTNLLDNAIKYRKAERGGRAWLRVSVDRRWLCFEVADDGMGVPAAHRKSIFDRFRRVEGSGRGKAGGHGLGLAFVAETARLHGGKAECLDGVEGGARFVLRIRRTPAPTDGAPRADGPRPS
jgi:two-component system phosphate regulon sensor histidine kinase PhoR